MSWLIWRQYRASTAITGVLVGLFAVLLVITGLNMASQFHADFGACLAASSCRFPTADVSFGLNDTAQWSAEWWLNTLQSQGYAGAIGWAWHDAAGNWSSFQPVFTAWGAAHPALVGPR